MGANLSYPESDLSGKVALVTGGNTGIGYETAKALARLGAHTFIGCRSKERAEQAIKRMQNELNPTAAPIGKEENNGGEQQASEEAGSNNDSGAEDVGMKNRVKIEYLPLDLSSFQSTKECVRLFKERDLPLHILVNNAAIAWMPFSMTLDGYETHLQVNYLAPMLLTLELLPILLSTAQSSGADGRISLVSSKANTSAETFNLEKVLVTREQDFSRYRAYCNTKLYCLMFGEALQRRLKEEAITVSSPEPGIVKTEIHRGFADKSILTFLTENLVYPIYARTPAEGAATTINCVVNPDLNSRQHHYYSDCRPARANREAYDQSKQELLWKKSFDLLADHLSPEILELYRPKDEDVRQETASDTEVSPGGGAASEAAATKQDGNKGETREGEILQDSVLKEIPLSEEPEAVGSEICAGEREETSKDSTDTAPTQQEVSEAGESNVHDSLPKEPIKERAEEREVTPPVKGALTEEDEHPTASDEVPVVSQEEVSQQEVKEEAREKDLLPEEPTQT